MRTHDTLQGCGYFLKAVSTSAVLVLEETRKDLFICFLPELTKTCATDDLYLANQATASHAVHSVAILYSLFTLYVLFLNRRKRCDAKVKVLLF